MQPRNAVTDHYATLGVTDRSEPEVIQAAYRALIRKYHPDTNPAADATLRCVEINRAYEVLADPVARAEYDASRAPAVHQDVQLPALATARKSRVPAAKHGTVEFLVSSAISVVAVTALMRLGVWLMPMPHDHERQTHHCQSVNGAAVAASSRLDCPVIQTIEVPPSAADRAPTIS